MKRILLAAILFTALVLASCGGGAKETITVYTAAQDDQIARYLEVFNKTNPDIEVNIVRDSTGIITARFLAEKDNPRADVLWGLAVTSLIVMDEEGLLEPYAMNGVERVLPQFKDDRNPPHWVGMDAWITAFVANTVELEAKGIPAPQSYADLIKPEYQGYLVMPNPASSGTGFLTVHAFITLYGEEAAWEYMDQLHANMALYTHSGGKPAKLAGSGEFPVGISFGYRGYAAREQGQPVETIFPEEGSGWDLEGMALVKKEEIKPAAKAFLDWAVSDAAMLEYAKNYAIITVDIEHDTPDVFPEDPKAQLVEKDFRWAAENRDRILAEWERRYNAKSEPKN